MSMIALDSVWTIAPFPQRGCHELPVLFLPRTLPSRAPHAGGCHEMPVLFLARTLPSRAPHAGGWHALPGSVFSEDAFLMGSARRRLERTASFVFSEAAIVLEILGRSASDFLRLCESSACAPTWPPDGKLSSPFFESYGYLNGSKWVGSIF